MIVFLGKALSSHSTSLCPQPWSQVLEKSTPLSSSSMLFKKLFSIDSVYISNIERGRGVLNVHMLPVVALETDCTYSIYSKRILVVIVTSLIAM